MRFVFALLLTTFAYANPIVFSPPTTLSSPTANASEIQVGADLSGNFVAVWIEDGVVKGATRPDGGSWSMPVSVSTADATSLQLTVDAGGNATAIWVDAGDIKASSLPFGGNWSNETTLSLLASSAPSIESDPSGNVIAVWVEAGAVKSKTKLAGMDWPVLSDTLAALGTAPQVALGPSGGAAVWQDVLNSIDAIYVSRKTIGGAWSASIAISNAQQNSKYPKIAIDPAGNMLAAWFKYSLSGGVYSNVIVQAAYGSASGTWGEPEDLSDPTVSGTLIFRNGQQIGSTPNFVATFVDHNQAQNGPVTYGVSFFLSNGDMSAPATVSLP